MTKKKKITLIVLTVILVLGGWWCYSRLCTGFRSGKVVDAVTGKPIEGAVVCMQWFTGSFFGIAGGTGAIYYETKTDEKGRYSVPCRCLNISHLFEGIRDENVMVYKDAYSGYEVSGTDYKPVGRSFASGTEDQPYRKKRNLIQLHRLKESDSHRDHIDWIWTFGIYGWPEQLLEKELRKEMERADKER